MASLRANGDSFETNIKKLRKRLAERAQQSLTGRDQTSTVPLDALNFADPMLEAALTNSAMQFFLLHMTNIDVDDNPESKDAPPLRRETITDDEIQTTMERLATPSTEEPPVLLEGFENERIWVVVDLLLLGDPRCRRRGTLELREYMRAIDAGEIDAEMLHALVEKIAMIPGCPLLLNMLAATAERAAASLPVRTAAPGGTE